MRKFITSVIDQAVAGDSIAILQLVAVIFAISFLCIKLKDAIYLAWRSIFSATKDMTNTPSSTKLLDAGYSRGLVKRSGSSK